MDHSKQSGFQPKISTSSNFQNNHRVSQVIEPVVNTITDAIKKGFTDYNSHKQYGNTACQVSKFIRFFAKNYHTQRKLLYFVNRHSGEVAKKSQNLTFKVNFSKS